MYGFRFPSGCVRTAPFAHRCHSVLHVLNHGCVPEEGGVCFVSTSAGVGLHFHADVEKSAPPHQGPFQHPNAYARLLAACYRLEAKRRDALI